MPSVSAIGSDLARLGRGRRPALDEPWPEYWDLACPDDGSETEDEDDFQG